MVVKKVATKKVAKKQTAQKVVKTPKTPKVIKSKVALVSFECSAVIPTQQYGNIQPKIVVTAPTIEEARSIVMPVMEDLYKTYAETPLSGRDPKFYGKVTVEEKKVETPAAAPKVEKPATESSPAASEQSSSQLTPAPAVEKPATPVSGVATPEPVLKARKAISLAASKEALALVRNQIENSVKIDPAFKPDLLILCDERYKELDVF